MYTVITFYTTYITCNVTFRVSDEFEPKIRRIRFFKRTAALSVAKYALDKVVNIWKKMRFTINFVIFLIIVITTASADHFNVNVRYF